MLIRRDPQGFTLVELMIATVTGVLLLGVMYQSVVITQRVTRAQGEQLGVQSSVRGAMLVVVNELRELSTVEGGSREQNDILSISPAGIVYRAMRGTGITCTASSSHQLRIGRSSFSGFRDPQAGRDSILVYADTTGTGAHPVWIPMPVGSVSAIPCPGSLPGITLTTTPAWWLSGQPTGLPVRVYEPMELRLYQSERKFWLGTRSLSAGEVIQPLFGPLSGEDGFRLDYLDRTGHPTSNVTAVRSIAVSVHGTSGAADEQLTTEVALRNASP
jgi:Tfp pilus assembly major pilin PilA